MKTEKQHISQEDLVDSLFVALHGYTKEAFLEGYDTALLNKKFNESPDSLYSESSVKKRIQEILTRFAPKELALPDNYVPCPKCLRLVHVTDECTCQY